MILFENRNWIDHP